MSEILKFLANFRSIARVCGTRTAFQFLCAFIITLPEVLRSKTLVSTDRQMSGRSWPFSLQGVSFELDGRFFGGAREMFCRQVYFPTPAFSLNPGTVVMDLGANVGLFSILAALVGCKVIAVEAQSGFVRELTELAKSYGIAKRIIVENALVGNRSGVFSDTIALASASHYEGSIPVSVMMAELMQKYDVDYIDFLKVDIEGSEFNLFQSNVQWLRKVQRIAMEVHPSFGSVTDLQAIISSQGMSVELRDSDLSVVSCLPSKGGYLFATR